MAFSFTNIPGRIWILWPFCQSGGGCISFIHSHYICPAVVHSLDAYYLKVHFTAKGSFIWHAKVCQTTKLVYISYWSAARHD